MKQRTFIVFVFACLWLLAMFALFGVTVAFAHAAPAQIIEATPTLRPLPSLDIPIKTQLPMQMSNAGRAPFLNIEQVMLPDDLLQAILEGLQKHVISQRVRGSEAEDPLRDSTRFVLTSARLEENWALVSLGAVDGTNGVPGYVGDGESGALILAHLANGQWQIAIEGESEFDALLADAPDAFVNAEAKSLLRMQTPTANSAEAITPTVVYKWPWAAGSTFYWWQGWHSRSALDMGTTRSDRRVLASASGVVRFICKGKLGAAVKIKDADGVTLEYWHIDTKLLDIDIKEGAVLTQGQVLGSLRPGTWVDPTCGNQFTQQSATNAHVHWELPKDRPFIVEGWTITQTQSVFTNGSQKRVCVGACYSSFVGFNSSNIAFSGRTQLSVAPALGLIGQGEPITLAVGISNVRDLSAFQISLSYSPTQLALQNIASGDWQTDTDRVFTNTITTIFTPSVGLAAFNKVGADRTSAVAYIGVRARTVGTATLTIGTPQDATLTGTATFSVVAGCAGDYDHDRDVDMLDVQHVAYRWDTKLGDVPFDKTMDTDGDGRITQDDLQPVTNRVGTQCGLKPRTHAADAFGVNASSRLFAISDTVIAGEIFTVGLVVSDVNALGAFDVSLGYSSTQFEVLSVAMSDFATRTSRSFTPMDWLTRTASTNSLSETQPSTINFSAYSLGVGPAGPSGAGQLAEVTLRALSAGKSELRVEAMQFSDVAGKPQAVSPSALSIQVIDPAPEIVPDAEKEITQRVYLPMLISDEAVIEFEATPSPEPTAGDP